MDDEACRLIAAKNSHLDNGPQVRWKPAVRKWEGKVAEDLARVALLSCLRRVH
jgi:hypothetical protein